MPESWRGTVTSKPAVYADGDQKLTVRVEPEGASPDIKKGEKFILTRQGAVTPVPPPPPVPEPVPIPDPTPTPVPLPPVSTGPERALLGGYRIAAEFARGGIAIDFDRNKLWMAGHAQRWEICEYDLPAMGTGSDVDAWPRVDPVRIMPPWWPKGYPNGLAFWRGKLWVAPRVFYDSGADDPNTPSPEASSEENLILYAADGETIELPYDRQAFSGFVKRGPGLDPYIGCGGYESGQGTSAGPTLATLDGKVLIEYGWPGEPGPNLEHWNERAPRDPNYRNMVGFANLGDTAAIAVPGDSWTGWLPRDVNGTLEGRWASDRIFGGGLALPEGITYWAWMGIGDLDYRWQGYTFAKEQRTYRYRYDPTTFQLLGYEAQPQFDTNGLNRDSVNAVCGQELGTDGKVYFAHGYQWASGRYVTDVALKVFG